MRASTQEIADLKKSLMENIIFCGVRPKPNNPRQHRRRPGRLMYVQFTSCVYEDGYYCRNHIGDRLNDNHIMPRFEPPSRTQI